MSRLARVLSVVALAVAAAAVACSESPPGRADPGRWTGAVDTAADSRVTVTNTGGGAWARDTVRARRTLLLGEAGVSSGSEATTFGDVTSLAVDSGGRIYVGDRISNSVRAFGLDGDHLGLVGGEGEGPGEFRWPEALALGPEGRLYVAEVEGVTVMAPRSDGGLPTQQVEAWQPVATPQAYRPLRVTCRGRIFYPHQSSRPTEHFYLRLGDGGGVVDTVEVPDMPDVPSGVPWFRTGPGGGRMLRGVDRVPLAPVPSWDVTPDGRLLVGEAHRYRLLFISPGGDTSRVVRREVSPRPIPEPVRRESTEALRTRLDTLPVPVDEVNNLPDRVADLELPSRYPAHLEVRAGMNGNAWVERPPRPDRPHGAPYDVFDRRGVYLGTVVVPVRFDPGRGFTNARSRPQPIFTDEAVYGVVVDPVTGVQRVARFSYDLPEREDEAPPPPAAPCAPAGSEVAS